MLGGSERHSLHIGKCHCTLFSRITDKRPGYLQRDGTRQDFAKIHFSGNGQGHTIHTNIAQKDIWALVIDAINFDTLRDTLWAIRSLTTNGQDINEMYLGYDCNIPLRVSFYKSIEARATKDYTHNIE